MAIEPGHGPGHGLEHPAVSHWIRRWSHLVAADASVLDLACGSGRHLRWFADRGCRVTGVDRDAAATAPLRAIAEIVVADLEDGAWPLAGRRFGAVVVTNYLWRLRLDDLLETVAPGGLLIYETFAAGHETIGRPSRPEFLLRPGELLRIAAGWRVIAFEDGFEDASGDGRDPSAAAAGRYVQRIVATRPAVADAAAASPPRYPLGKGAPPKGDPSGSGRPAR